MSVRASMNSCDLMINGVTSMIEECNDFHGTK